MVCDMPEPRKFPSLDSCQTKFLWNHKAVDLAPRPVIGLVLQSRRYEEVSSSTWFRKSGSIFQSQQAGSMFHSHRGGWG